MGLLVYTVDCIKSEADGASLCLLSWKPGCCHTTDTLTSPVLLTHRAFYKLYEDKLEDAILHIIVKQLLLSFFLFSKAHYSNVAYLLYYVIQLPVPSY